MSDVVNYSAEDDDVLIDEQVLTQPVKSIKVKARIGRVRHVTVSRPLFDAPDDYLIDECVCEDV